MYANANQCSAHATVSLPTYIRDLTRHAGRLLTYHGGQPKAAVPDKTKAGELQWGAHCFSIDEQLSSMTHS
jgi:hypothetical protein